MLPSVLARTARDQRRSLAVWAVALVALVGMYLAFYPSIRGNTSYTKLIDEMPKAYRALFSVTSGADFTSAAGYLNTELLSFMGPLLVLIYGIGTGAAAVAGEEDRHTMDLLLANPVSRSRVLVEKFAALCGGVTMLMAVLWAALVHLGLLGIEFGALALLVGALTGHLTVARAIPALLAVISYLINGFGQLVGWLRPLRPISPFYAYNGHDPLRTGLWPTGIAIVVATTVALVIAAAGAFRHRDVLA